MPTYKVRSKINETFVLKIFLVAPSVNKIVRWKVTSLPKVSSRVANPPGFTRRLRVLFRNFQSTTLCVLIFLAKQQQFQCISVSLSAGLKDPYVIYDLNNQSCMYKDAICLFFRGTLHFLELPKTYPVNEIEILVSFYLKDS